MSSLQKHSAALDLATAPVVDQAAAAYTSANEIHKAFLRYDAYERFGKEPVYRPKEIQPLLSQSDIDVRLAILAAFQLYVKNIVQVTGGTDTPQLQAASKSLGGSLTTFANTVAPSVEGALKIEVADATAPAVSAAAGNGISTAINALGQFLASRKVKQQLPGIVVKMDQQLQPLWDAMQKDVSLLASQESREYDSMIDDQTGFLLANPNLDPQVRREQIMGLPEFVWKQRNSAQQLAQLHHAIYNLAMVHHAFAAAAQQNNPESLKTKLDELAAAGQDLGRFYSSLSTS